VVSEITPAAPGLCRRILFAENRFPLFGTMLVARRLGRNLFPEYLPALAGWIGDAVLIDRFIPRDGDMDGARLPGRDHPRARAARVGRARRLAAMIRYETEIEAIPGTPPP
jgi:hypothetical protein